MAEKHPCCGKKWTGFNHVLCRNNAKVDRDGKWYCGTHDPVAIKQKDDARKAEWKAKSDAQEAEWDARHKRMAEQARRAGCFDSLVGALKRIDEMCAAPPNFSDATIQDIARAAIAAAETDSNPPNTNEG